MLGVRAGIVIVALVVIIAVGVRVSDRVAYPSSRRYATVAGQIAALTLTDGTHITLAPRSRLDVLDGDTRNVTLVGEAYFDVQQTTGRPFVVHTGTIQTRVLGTSFDIATDAVRGAVRVAVVSGKVSSGGIHPAILTAGTVAHVTDSTAVDVAPAGTAAQYSSWTSGRLMFRNAPVEEILATLSRWYDVDFHVSDSTLLQRHVTGIFDAKSQADALTALKGVLDAAMTYQHNGDRLVILIRPLDAQSIRVPNKKAVRDSFMHSQTEVGR